MDFAEFLIQYAVFPIAIICYGLGYIIKHYIKQVPNKYIPVILAVFGTFLNLAFNGFNLDMDTLNLIEVLMIGAGSGLAATGGFEAVRNLKEKQKQKQKEKQNENQTQ